MAVFARGSHIEASPFKPVRSRRRSRLAGDHGDVVRIELGLLRSFRKYALSDAHCTDTIWHWLALAQHAGLPTRLLDWTYSPLVALHFATARLERFDQDGEVWCVDFARVNKLLPRRLRQLLDEHTRVRQD